MGQVETNQLGAPGDTRGSARRRRIGARLNGYRTQRPQLRAPARAHRDRAATAEHRQPSITTGRELTMAVTASKRPYHRVVDGHKVCNTCLVRKPIDCFSKSGTNGRFPHCRPCRSESRRRAYAADPRAYIGPSRLRKMKYLYGITADQYRTYTPIRVAAARSATPSSRSSSRCPSIMTMPVALAKRHVGNASGDCCATGATFFWATRKTTLITSVGRSHI